VISGFNPLGPAWVDMDALRGPPLWTSFPLVEGLVFSEIPGPLDAKLLLFSDRCFVGVVAGVGFVELEVVRFEIDI
jgi:hypothetical protein